MFERDKVNFSDKSNQVRAGDKSCEQLPSLFIKAKNEHLPNVDPLKGRGTFCTTTIGIMARIQLTSSAATSY